MISSKSEGTKIRFLGRGRWPPSIVGADFMFQYFDSTDVQWLLPDRIGRCQNKFALADSSLTILFQEFSPFSCFESLYVLARFHDAPRAYAIQHGRPIGE